MRRTKTNNNEVDLFLDSGAFSAWTQGTAIDIYEYIKFIKEHKEFIHIYANLDVISVGGKKPNKDTAEATLKNQKIMEDAGLTPLPCFHFGEPYSYLEYYVNNYTYIALGVAGNSGTKLIPWLNECFSKYICDDKGMPKVKVHGFAVTSLKLMIRYPWYSVDSTSWALTGGMGSIYVPKYSNGKWIYDENSLKIAVSSQSPKNKSDGQHFTTMKKSEQDIILNYIHSKGYSLGKSEFIIVDQSHLLKGNERWADKKPKNKNSKRLVEVIIEPGLSNQYQLRDELNIIYFHDLEKTIPEWPWPFKIQGIMQSFFNME